ncbi:MAG: hypothetical protein WB777_22385 [Mycobacterium sp.]
MFVRVIAQASAFIAALIDASSSAFSELDVLHPSAHPGFEIGGVDLSQD